MGMLAIKFTYISQFFRENSNVLKVWVQLWIHHVRNSFCFALFSFLVITAAREKGGRQKQQDRQQESHLLCRQQYVVLWDCWLNKSIQLFFFFEKNILRSYIQWVGHLLPRKWNLHFSFTFLLVLSCSICDTL